MNRQKDTGENVRFSKDNQVLQVNLEDAGGAFTLIYQLQKQMYPKVFFDYFTMGKFKSDSIKEQIEKMNGRIIEADIRQNRLWGSVLLPVCFYNFLKKNKYDCIHIHSDTAWKLLVYAYPARKAKIKRIIVHSHSSNVNGDYKFLKKLCHYIVKPLLPRYANILLACSDKAANWMFPRAKEKQIHYIINGIDIKKFKFSENNRNTIRKKLGIANSTILIGVVGDMSFTKNPIFIVDVIKLLVSENKNYKLLFVGEGKDSTDVIRYVKDKGLDDFVTFLGHTSEIEKVYSALDIFAMPSRFEGFPVSVIEAQASGLPCILSSHITCQVNVLGTCKYINIEKRDMNLWKETFLYFSREQNREAASEQLISAGYDISKTTQQMIEIYQK